jgi:DNA-binding NarL/FixJ family response regulator
VGAIRIVVAEDESMITLGLRESLDDDGYEVVAETARDDDAL